MIDKQLNYGRHVIRRFLEDVSPFEAVLDLGAGSGSDLDAAAGASPAAKLYGAESYPPNVERLQAKGILVTSSNLERDPLPFADEFFDVVMANQVMEHLKEIFWVLHEMSRTLRVGGHLILGVPNLASLHNRLLLAVGRQPTCIQNHSAHVRGYTRHDLLRMFEMIFPGGYAMKGFGGSNFYPLPPVLAKPAARLFPNAAVAILLLLEKRKAYQGEFLEHPIRQQLETNFYLGERAEDFGHKV